MLNIAEPLGKAIRCVNHDKGHRGHNAAPEYKSRVYISGQKRGVTHATSNAASGNLTVPVAPSLPSPR